MGIFSPKGRINRLDFLWINIFAHITAKIISFVLLFTYPNIAVILSPVLIIMACIISVMLTIKRFHDLDQSGWLTLIMLIPFVNIVALVYLLIARGTEGSNRFDEALV